MSSKVADVLSKGFDINRNFVYYHWTSLRNWGL
jgi:hypothetical protein